MIRPWAIAFLLGFAPAAMAVNWNDFVVKVSSRLCLGGRPFLGSGVLLADSGKAYILTSDHVELHVVAYRNDLETYCQTFHNERFGQHRFQYLTSEEGNGLAILRVEDLSPQSDWPVLRDFSAAPARLNDAVTISGFPSDSDNLVTDGGGKVSDPNSPQHLFALLANLIEVRGAQGEFGMSGGPVWRADGAFVGTLSHQILKGHENELRLVPGTVAHDWLAAYFADPVNFLVYLWRSDGEQLNDGYLESGTIAPRWYCGFHPPRDCRALFNYWPSSHSRLLEDPGGVMRRIAEWVRHDTNESPTHWAEVWGFRRGRETIRVTSLVDFFQKLYDSTLTPCVDYRPKDEENSACNVPAR